MLAQAITARYPEDGFGWAALGWLLRMLGRSNDSLAPLQKAAVLSPSNAAAFNNLGLALQDFGRVEEAESCYREALRLTPDFVEAHFNLGNVLRESGRLDEAEASYREAVLIRPDFVDAHNNLGCLQSELGKLGEAAASFRRVIELKPDFAEVHTNLGVLFQHFGQLEDAEASHRAALRIASDFAKAHNNLGNTLKELGRLDEADASFRRAIEIVPDNITALSNLIASMTYRPMMPCYMDEVRKYGRMVTGKVATAYSSWLCETEPVRLRIGLVSGDLRKHAVSYFLGSVLANIDSSSFELYAYPTHHESDELTDRIKPWFSAWKSLCGLSDESAVRLIHSDGVHILIDLSGHTAYNRLPVFAWRPAPVQISWLGYWATTGVEQIDYLMADPYTLPESEAANFTEKVWRLPETRLCFTAPDLDIPVSRLPSQANGYVTFACFGNLTKMNDAVIALWSRVLASVPGSRLILKANQLGEESVRKNVIARFGAQDFDAERLILDGPDSREDYLATYHKVDIVLDTFPFSGGTTSAESLWMGVPVLTLAGERLISRQGAGLLKSAGLTDWIANDPDDYVRRAVIHAGNLDRLAELRSRLRQQVLASPVFDAPRFARHFEEALRQMWQVHRTKVDIGQGSVNSM